MFTMGSVSLWRLSPSQENLDLSESHSSLMSSFMRGRMRRTYECKRSSTISPQNGHFGGPQGSLAREDEDYNVFTSRLSRLTLSLSYSLPLSYSLSLSLPLSLSLILSPSLFFSPTNGPIRLFLSLSPLSLSSEDRDKGQPRKKVSGD